MEALGKYLVMIAAIAAGAALIIYGNPASAKEWGTLATAAITAYVAWQQRETQKTLRQQDVESTDRTQKIDAIAEKVEIVHKDVNSAATANIEASAAAGYAEGVKQTVESLKPVIAEAVAQERQLGEDVRRDERQR